MPEAWRTARVSVMYVQAHLNVKAIDVKSGEPRLEKGRRHRTRRWIISDYGALRRTTVSFAQKYIHISASCTDARELPTCKEHQRCSLPLQDT
jgi:hypothetical protein